MVMNDERILGGNSRRENWCGERGLEPPWGRHIFGVQYSPTSAGETGMKIAIESSDELEQVRTRLRKMTDAQLVNFGKAARSLCRNRDCPDTFRRQLQEAKAEWRRRHQ